MKQIKATSMEAPNRRPIQRVDAIIELLTAAPLQLFCEAVPLSAAPRAPDTCFPDRTRAIDG